LTGWPPTLAEPRDVELSDGRRMPRLGFGVWQIPDDGVEAAVAAAIGAGNRLIDTASLYANERGVGRAVRAAPLPRDQLFVTTKLGNEDHGFDKALRAYDASLARLGLDYVDLYLIHWPRPLADRYVESWRALVRLKEEGRVRSIGVSNFEPHHIERIVKATGVWPVVNQVELHPRWQQRALRSFHGRHAIVTQSWSPLGRGHLDNSPVLARIAAKHGKTWAQVIIRWTIDCGLTTLTRTVRPERMRENIDVFDFQLDADDIAAIAALDAADGRFGPDPETYLSG